MKKILCLVLALMLSLTAVAALAGNSKGGQDIPEEEEVVDETAFYIQVLTETPDWIAAEIDALATADPAEKFASLNLPEGSAVYEALSIVAHNYDFGDKVAEIALTSVFADSQKVSVVVGLPGSEIAYTALKAETTADGKLAVTFPADVLSAMGEAPALLLVLATPAE